MLDVTRWRDRKPDRLTRMVAHDAVWLNAEDAHAFEAGTFRSAKAAEHVRGRVADAREAVRAIVRNDPRPWLQVRYQLRRQGMHVREALAPAGADRSKCAPMRIAPSRCASMKSAPSTSTARCCPLAEECSQLKGDLVSHRVGKAARHRLVHHIRFEILQI